METKQFAQVHTTGVAELGSHPKILYIVFYNIIIWELYYNIQT